MNKACIFLFLFVLISGCSKDKGAASSWLEGKWNAVLLREVYQNTDGTPFRNEVIQADRELINPDYPVIISSKVMRLNEGVLPYTLYDGYFILGDPDEQTIRFDYTLDGKKMSWENVLLDTPYYNPDGDPADDPILIPKLLTTIVFVKER